VAPGGGCACCDGRAGGGHMVEPISRLQRWAVSSFKKGAAAPLAARTELGRTGKQLTAAVQKP
jgi:hypothetical protein